ncbi:MAG: molybdopterin-dependent oxidoreductase [Candidatus Competibacteraceae bacterium]|nr:molybdopterin-dependent oxidoreductase [Candidatus Competibacteraceae bacterium]MCB1810348.1 molybdopterin-dependent oxidoreductase [Candidatus Competibacteraceae bacterium]
MSASKSASAARRIQINGQHYTVHAAPITPLATVLRDELGLYGTKIGCEAGDCGACTVLLGGAQVCACLLPLAQVGTKPVVTVEGLAEHGQLSLLQQAFLEHGAAQCGICTPGMLMAAHSLLSRNPQPDRQQVLDALGGVLCRCTGYLKIIEAILAVAARSTPAQSESPAAGQAVGARLAKVDGVAKVTGREIYAADQAPADSLWLRVVRSPHARARFTVGDLTPVYQRFPGLVRIFSAADVPGNNGFGIYPHIKDQPVLADGIVRYRGDAVLALVGDKYSVTTLTDEQLPIGWQPETPLLGLDAALNPAAACVQADKPDNILVRGRLRKGDTESAFRDAAHQAEGVWQTSCVEHAYIEPEAGYARRVGDRLEIFVTTQAPYMDRDETAQVLGLEPTRIRIIPSACGGGFGGKLDVSVQPLLGLAAWHLNRPVRCVYTRPESMRASTKRHPARIQARAACNADGTLCAFEFHGDFDTGAYASWGPTVADRVPIHCSGPYFVPHVRADSVAVLSNAPPSGAFRGFGVPQAALAHEALMDALAQQAGLDALEFRLRNAIRAGQATASGQVLTASAGLAQCLDAVRPHWQAWRAEAERYNAHADNRRRGVGIGCMWYGCGNTSMSNPSTMRIGINRAGTLTLYSGAVDIGQGANTILLQIAADALGVPAGQIRYVMGDTDRTADAGKSSASRQTLVSGRAAELAGMDLRQQILRLTNAGPGAQIELASSTIRVLDGTREQHIDLTALTPLPDGDPDGDVLLGEGSFDPPTSALNENGQGSPYATYGFAAQIAEVDVDIDLGTVQVRRIVAAHDVGRAVNPTQVEGQIHGGIAQGLGLALMEDYIPGRTENLHDYLIPTAGDMPEIDVIIIEDPEPLGPFGAKGIGEPALVPTAPAILGAIQHATGVRIHQVPATPDRVLQALQATRNI